MKRLLLLICSMLIAGLNSPSQAGSLWPTETKKPANIEQKVILQEMDAESFKDFKAQYIERSTQNRMENDLDTREVTQLRAISEISRMLPLGLETPNNFIFHVIAADTKKKIGILWYVKMYEGSLPVMFLYEICIFDEFQHKGYGTALLKMYEQKAKEMGANKLRLHVFANNEGARKLYSRLGYFLTGYNMAKNIK